MAKRPIKKGRGGYDPTKTTGIRNAMLREVGRRLLAIKRIVRAQIGIEDILGLTPKPLFNTIDIGGGITLNATYRFQTDEQRLKAFQEWFAQQVKAGLLGVASDGIDPTTPWLTEYVDSAYRRGMLNAYVLTKGGTTEDQKAFLQQAFAAPEAMSKIRFLATRDYALLKGVSDDMSNRMNRIMADAIANGLGARETSRNLEEGIDGMPAARARMIARTELIAAHAQGQLDAFQKLGVEELGVMAEFATAGDSRVCPICAPLEGKVYTLAEAQGVIPQHGNCRCSWIPYLGADINKAIDKNMGISRK